jgi:hypothetical protein
MKNGLGVSLRAFSDVATVAVKGIIRVVWESLTGTGIISDPSSPPQIPRRPRSGLESRGLI